MNSSTNGIYVLFMTFIHFTLQIYAKSSFYLLRYDLSRTSQKFYSFIVALYFRYILYLIVMILFYVKVCVTISIFGGSLLFLTITTRLIMLRMVINFPGFTQNYTIIIYLLLKKRAQRGSNNFYMDKASGKACKNM